jgi:hypothetical protein
VHDNPVLRVALRDAERVVPLFVVDTGIRRTGFAVPNRAAFLADSVADLDAALRQRGGRLVVRVGDVVEETCRVAAEAGADTVHIAGGVSRYAVRREDRLRAASAGDRRELRMHDTSLTAVPAGALTPSGGGNDRPAGSGALVVRHRQTAMPTDAPTLIQRRYLADLMSRLIAIRVCALPSSSWALLCALARALTSSSTESAACLSVESSVSIWTLNSATCAPDRRANPRFRIASGSSDGSCSCSQNQRCIKQRRRLIIALP